MLVFPQAIVRSFAYGGMAAIGIAAVLSLSALPQHSRCSGLASTR